MIPTVPLLGNVRIVVYLFILQRDAHLLWYFSWLKRV